MGFSMLEILGAGALILTLAAVSVLSVKDSVAAGQRSSVQRELQGLNTALSNFKSAGGVIAENATTEDALSALMAGVSLSGSAYTPLTSMPDTSQNIGDIPYSLAYDSTTGFSYVPSGSELGDVLSASGLKDGVGANGQAYPFDITNPAEITQALSEFAGMSPTDPRYQSYLEALNAARAHAPYSSVNEINTALDNKGLVLANNAWQQPIFDPTNPVAVANAITLLPSLRSDDTYQNYIATLNEALGVSGADSSSINTALKTELMNALTSRDANLLAADWSKVNFSGTTSLANVNFVGSNVNGAQLNAVTNLTGVVLGPMDLSGFNFKNKTTTNMNIAGSSNIADKFWALIKMNEGVNAAGVDFSNAGHMSGPNHKNIVFTNCNLAGVGWSFSNMYGSNFTGADMTGVQLYRVNMSAGLSVSGITGAQVASMVSIHDAQFQGQNMTGLGNFTTKPVFTGPINMNGAKNLSAGDMAKIWNTSYSNWCDLRGTGITKAAMTTALMATYGYDEATAASKCSTWYY